MACVERPEPPFTVAISECLTGAEVRFDGGHKRGALCHDVLDGLFRYRPLCPEVAIGLGVPRAPIRLVGMDDGAIRVRGVRDPEQDVTTALQDYAERVAPTLQDVCGYILMKNSPSCGMERVKVYRAADGMPTRNAAGAYAEVIMRRCPQLPVEENGRLGNPLLRENFVTRVFTRAHWQAQMQAGLTPAALLEFHSRYKYLLMAHSSTHYRRAGQLLADLKAAPLAGTAGDYFVLLMEGLKKLATRGTHANALQHLQGYLKRDLEAASRQELASVIDAYRRGEVPLVVPVTLLRHLLRRFPDDYALKQVYFDPHPADKGLRNAI